MYRRGRAAEEAGGCRRGVAADIARAVDAAAQRAEAWRGVDRVVERIEARAASRTGEALRRSEALAPVKAAAGEIVAARMTDSGASAYAAARTGAVARVVETVAILVGADGAERVERSEATALVAPNACAVFRLAAKGAIDEPGVKAALTFAAAGDVVLGPVRVRTVDFWRVAGGAPGEAVDGAAAAVERWRIALGELTRSEFRVLDAVMRHDQTSAAAAQAIWPRERERKKLVGMGDALLITSCETLSAAYGFRGRNEYAPSRFGVRA